MKCKDFSCPQYTSDQCDKCIKIVENKIEFESEKEARDFYNKYIWADENGKRQQRFIDNLNFHKAIKKPELENLVESAEEMYNDWDSCGDKNGFQKWKLEGIVKSLYEAIHTMKSQLKEWGGER